MTTTPRARLISQQASIQKMLRAKKSPLGVFHGIGHTVKNGTALMVDFVRHAMVFIGIVGLVGLAVGATTECKSYHEAINWISSIFIS